MVRDALAAGGVICEVEAAGADHPYTANALARPMRIFVAPEQLAEARRLLAALEGELANHDEDLTAQALAAGRLIDEESVKEAPPDHRPSLGLALALGLLLPAPVVCFYARANRIGLLFLLAFVLGLVSGQLPMFSHRDAEYDDEGEDSPLVWMAPAAKVVDFAVGIPLVVFRRRARKT
jgi:hypothetical protein